MRRPGSEVYVNKVAYRLSDRTAPEPDLSFVATGRAHIARHGYMDGPPDLAIEVVSPESVRRDYEDKRERYTAGGVQEYWILDPDERRATILCREDDRFVEIRSDGEFESRVLPGLRLDTRSFWRRPLPPALPILQELLAR